MTKLNRLIPTRPKHEPDVPPLVLIYRWRSSEQHLAAFKEAAEMVGGPIGQAILTALDDVRDDVLGEALQ